MGHVGRIEATYTTNKIILPVELLNAMQESFVKATSASGHRAPCQKDKSAETKHLATRRDGQ